MSTPWKALSAKTRNTALIISLTIFLAGCFLGWHFIVKPSFLKMALLKNEKIFRCDNCNITADSFIDSHDSHFNSDKINLKGACAVLVGQGGY